MPTSDRRTPTLASATATTVARVEELELLEGLHAIASAAAGAEPPREDMVRELRAGRQPFLVVVHGLIVLLGAALLAAAKAAGRKTIEVTQFPGCDGLHPGELLILGAGLHLQAALDRKGLSPFEKRLLNARVYEAWARNRKSRGPRRGGRSKRDEREQLRSRLIKQAFGRSQRSLERDLVLLMLMPGLQDAVRLGRLPEKYIEPAGKLTFQAQKSLASMLTSGSPFADIKEQFFASESRRKSGLGAAKAIRTSISTLVTEARGREHYFALRAEEFPVAREAAVMLANWLLAAPPTQSIAERVNEVAGDLRGRPRGRGDDSGTTGGDPGARGGSR